MTEKMKSFQNACRAYLSSLGIGDLRNYGREIGVARPTAKKKEELVEEIIAILCGLQVPIPVSKQGAPVKNDRVDERIVAHLSKLKAEFFSNDVMIEFPEYDFQKEYDKMIEENRSKKWYAADPAGEKLGFRSEEVTWGQVHSNAEGYFVLPMDCGEVLSTVHLPEELVRAKDLRVGDEITCYTRIAPNEVVTVEEVVKVNGRWTETPPNRPHFEDCAVCTSTERIRVFNESKYKAVALKFIEWLLPIAKGQRGCVISAPKAGKTRLLLQIAAAASALNEDLEVYALLIDQAPEAVREFQGALKKASLFWTTYEDDADRQVLTADFLLNRAKRLAENGKDVLLVVDSLTALARAYNDTEESAGGKTLSCGLEIKTMRYMKKYFGAARCLEQGGSITILGAVSAETGNPFDDVVCAEFAAQANFEIRLSNAMAMRRMYPAMELPQARAKQRDGFLSEREEEVDFLLRNEVIEKIGAEGLLTILLQASSYEEFVKRIESI